MLTPEERTLLVEQQDRLIDLFVQRKEASRAEDRTRVQSSALLASFLCTKRSISRSCCSTKSVRSSGVSMAPYSHLLYDYVHLSYYPNSGKHPPFPPGHSSCGVTVGVRAEE